MRPNGMRRDWAEISRRAASTGLRGSVQILRQHVASAEGQNPYGNLRPGDSLDHIEDGSVTAADQDRIEALVDTLAGLVACGLSGKSLNDLNRTPSGAKHHSDARDGIAMDPPLLKDRIDKQQDTTHPQSAYRHVTKQKM